MIVFTYLLLLLIKLISAQRLGLRGERLGLRPFYNVAPKPGPGVGVLQDLSNARILSNEPFIISFEFPKMERPGNPRKSKFGAKRSRTQRKKNRRLRQFRQVLFPEGDYLERAKRYQSLQKPLIGGTHFKNTNLMILDEAKARSLTQKSDNGRLYDRSGFKRYRNFEDDEITSRPASELQSNILQQVINTKREENTSEENIDAGNHKQWENIKGKWMSLFQKDKEPGNDMDEEQARIKAKSQKMWANCQLLKLLKAPQRNPYFYKLLPPNYPALVMYEEKQLQCNKVYDIIDLSKDKKMISEKIKQLEKILSSDYEDGSSLPVVWKTEEEPKTRKRRDVQVVEKKPEEQNTLQDESLQGKTEGEVRTDRNRRTKERLNKRKRNRTRGERAKNKKQKESPTQAEGEKQTENEQQPKETIRSERKAEDEQVTSNDIPKIVPLEKSDIKLDTHEHESERKKEREIKQGTILQDVFNPTEVNKVIKQKELEANIFDKVVRAMKKYEENNPYDESFVPQKRESRNETVEMPEKEDSGESILEVDDAVRKLAKIFKILGVKTEKKKCSTCDATEESSYEEEAGKIKKTDIVRANTQNGKCTCDDDCPVCHNCLRCFKECKKNMVTARNKETTAITAYKDGYPGLTSASKPLYSTGGLLMAEPPLEDNIPGRSNQPKAERMYRSKLPPSKDFIKVYFDNPDNKLLVWTKRGRRTMPWGPLTSDLQLYRDRAKQILKSAEDILQRIKETEDKIHGTPQIDEINQEVPQVSSNNEKNMDDIIKKVVNEDAMKKFLTTPWKDKVEATGDTKKEVDGISRGIHVHEDELESNGKNDPEIRNEEYGRAPMPDIESLFQSEEFEEASKEAEKIDNDSKTLDKKLNSVLEEPESVEAAVHPIEGNQEKTPNTLNSNSDAVLGNKEVGELEDYQDIPAKVEAVSDNKMFKTEVQDDGSEKVSSENKDFSKKNQVEEAKVRKTSSQKSEKKDDKVKKVFGEKSEEEDGKVKKAFSEESEEEEATVKKVLSNGSEEEDMKVKKAFSEESEEGASDSKKKDVLSPKEIIKQLKKAVEKHKKMERERNKKVNKYHAMVENKAEGERKDLYYEEESKRERNNISDEKEPAEIRKNLHDDGEPLKERKNEKYDSDEEVEEERKNEKYDSDKEVEEERKNEKYDSDEEGEAVEERKNGKYDSDEEGEAVEERKNGKYDSDEEEVEEERKNEKYDSDEGEAEEERNNEKYDSDEGEAVEERKNEKYDSDEGEAEEERKNEKYDSDEGEAVEERKNEKYDSDEGEAVEERNNEKYDSDEEGEAVEERKNGKYDSDEEEVEEERKNEKYDSDEGEAEEERKNEKYDSDEGEAVEERNNEKYDSDEGEAVEERNNEKYDSDEEGEAVEERKNGKYDSDEEVEEERNNEKYDSDEEVEEERKNEKYDSDEGEAVEERNNEKYDSDEEGEAVEERKNGKYDSDEEEVEEERKNEKYDSDEGEAVEERNNEKYDSDEGEAVEERKNGKYDSDEEEVEEERKNEKYDSDEGEAVEERKNEKYDSDEGEAVEERKNEKYDSDEGEAVEERKNGKYDSDEYSDVNVRKSTHNYENKDMGKIKNSHIEENKDKGENKNFNSYSRDDVIEEKQKDTKKKEKVKPVDLKAIYPVEQGNENADAERAKSTDPNKEYKSDRVSNQNIYEDHIKPLEEDYIIKGVKKTKEEKDAILKALMNTKEKTEDEHPQEETTESFYYYTHPTEMSQQTPKPVEHTAGDGLQTLIQHIQGGYMNEEDIKAVKKLDESKIVSLVGEMQKNDKQKATIDCKKEIELCKIACGCNESNSTTTEVDKYDIMKGFLRWLKNVQLDQMVPISV